jgi:hypothetical protein
MPFRQTDLHDLDVAREVRIETRDDKGDVHSTIVWIVVDGGDVFVRSVRGERGRWWREAMAHRQVTIDDAGRRLAGILVPATDAESIGRVDAALTRKYANDEGYDSMLDAESRQTTARIEPQFPNEVPLEAPAYLGADEPSELGDPIDVSMLDGGAAVPESVILQPRKPA